ncbi:MAG: hypothetical protein FK734_16330 [Asgard group archaeon]|nr:hypothetical protein [Asgard group archaeon]
MKIKKIIVLLTLSLLLIQTIIIQNMNTSSSITTKYNTSLMDASHPISDTLSSKALAGTEIVKTNVYPEGDMEAIESNGEPTAFYGWGTGTSVANFTYKDEVHSGSYGGYISSKGTVQYSTYYQGYRDITSGISELSYIDEDINLNFWYNAKANPDYSFGTEIYITIRFMTNLGNYYIHYFLSRVSGLPGNGTNTAYFDIRGSLNSWINIDRNITDDFVSVFSAGLDYSLSYCRYFYLTVTSIQNPSGATILLIDDVYLTNGTGFNYLADNGNFEDGDAYPWVNNADGPAYLYTTSLEKIQGMQSMNMTVTDLPIAPSNSYLYATRDIYENWINLPKGYYSGAPGDLLFNFMWKYSDNVGSGGQQFGCFYFYAVNATFTATITLYLGTESGSLPSINQTYSTSGSYAIKAPGFGVRDTWQEISIDFYYLLNIFQLSNLIPYQMSFNLNARNTAGCTNHLYIDDFQVITYPANDPGFEGNLGFSASDPILYWRTSLNQDYVNVTTDAHFGNYAANITAYSGIINPYCARFTFLPITDNLYTDFSWRLDKLTNIGNVGYSEIRLVLDGSKVIHYIVGQNSYYNPTNNSNNCYYFDSNLNTMGQWRSIIRDLRNDATVAFGEDNWNVTEIDIRNYAAGSEVVSTLWDDINFITDVTGPIINSLENNPSIPEYDDDVVVSVEVTDNLGVDSVELYYRYNSDPYTSVEMLLNGPIYEAVIPATTYGTSVSYYVESTDINGHTTDTESTLVTYIVGDFTNPILAVVHPSELEPINGTALFLVSAEDVGSGLASFEIAIDGIPVYTQLTLPMTYEWNTTSYTNGQHSIVFTVVDNAGNDNWIGYGYDVYNEQPSTTETNPLFGGIIILGFVSAIVATMLYLIDRRKRCL